MAIYQPLLTGNKIPSLGLGTAAFFDQDVMEKALDAALEAGYRHFDTAYSYKNSEQVIGKILKKWFDSGKLKRQDIFIVTKLPREAVHPDKVEQSIKESLQRLQTDYIDLYLIHFPIYTTPGSGYGKTFKPGDPLPTDHVATWKKMEEQVDTGRAKSIGLSNFTIKQIERIWQAARIKPSCLQIRLNVFLQEPELVSYCQSKGIVITGYRMLGAPRDGGDSRDIFKNGIIIRIAEKHKKNHAQIVLRYFLQKNIVAIPKSTNPERIKSNIDVFDFALDAEDMKSIEALNIGEKARGSEIGDMNPKLKEHPEYPWK